MIAFVADIRSRSPSPTRKLGMMEPGKGSVFAGQGHALTRQQLCYMAPSAMKERDFVAF
jgi:hypothetical protein